MTDKKILELPQKTTPADTDSVIVQEAGGAVGSTKFALLSGLWTWARSKADAVYAAIGHNHSGVYSVVSHNHSGVYDPAGTAAQVLATHVGASDPHSQYLTVVEGTAAYEAIGTAASAITTHKSDTLDPHASAGYLLSVVAGTNVSVDSSDPRRPVVSSSGGAAANSFGTVAVSGQSSVVAETAPDILTLAAGTNVQLTTNASTDTVTIAADHNHDSSYAALSHNHDSAYAALTHNHDSSYAALSHNHDSAYAALNHNHSGTYAALSHTHAASGITDFTEAAQDAIGAALTDSTTVDFTYNDDAGTISAAVLPAGLSGIAQSSITNLTTDLSTISSTASAAIPAPASPTTGDVLAYTGSAWARLAAVVAFTPSGAAVTVDFSTVGKIASVTLGDATTTFTLSGGLVGWVYILRLIQDASGSRAVSMPASVKFGSDITAMPTLSTGANKVDELALVCVTAGTAYRLIGYARGY